MSHGNLMILGIAVRVSQFALIVGLPILCRRKFEPFSLGFALFLLCWWCSTVGHALFTSFNGSISNVETKCERNIPGYRCNSLYSLENNSEVSQFVRGSYLGGVLPEDLEVGTFVRKERSSRVYEINGMRYRINLQLEIFAFALVAVALSRFKRRSFRFESAS